MAWAKITSRISVGSASIDTLLVWFGALVDTALLTLSVAEAGLYGSQFAWCSLVPFLPADMKVLRAEFQKDRICGMSRVKDNVEQCVDAGMSMQSYDHDSLT